MLTSLFFVVAGFLEFACVLQLARYNENNQHGNQFMRNGNVKPVELSFIENELTINPDEKPKFNLRKIDQVAFFFGALLFLLFNAIYWCTFLMFDFN